MVRQTLCPFGIDAEVASGTQADADNQYGVGNDPWGNGILPFGTPRNYYGWNAQWGYQYFADLQMYYAHGRWWRADTGIFLSPWAAELVEFPTKETMQMLVSAGGIPFMFQTRAR